MHWYHLARTQEPDDDVVARLTVMGKALLVTGTSVSVPSALRKNYSTVHVVQREGALDHARPKDSPTYGQVLSFLLILAHTA